MIRERATISAGASATCCVAASTRCVGAMFAANRTDVDARRGFPSPGSFALAFALLSLFACAFAISDSSFLCLGWPHLQRQLRALRLGVDAATSALVSNENRTVPHYHAHNATGTMGAGGSKARVVLRVLPMRKANVQRGHARTPIRCLRFRAAKSSAQKGTRAPGIDQD